MSAAPSPSSGASDGVAAGVSSGVSSGVASSVASDSGCGSWAIGASPPPKEKDGLLARPPEP